MDTVFIYIVIIVYFIVFSAYVIYRRKDFISPAVIFCCAQAIMFSGILSHAEYSIASDRKLLFFYLIALCFFCIGTLLRKRKPSYINYSIDDRDFTTYQQSVIVFLIIVSVILSSYLFANNGGNAFIISLRQLFSSSDANIVSLRSNYNQVRGIGYITQFRGVILPLLNILLLVNRKGKKLRTMGLILLPFTVTFLLGTGQRGQFVLLAIVLIADMYMQKRFNNFKINIGKITILGLIVFILFSVLSVTNGRTNANDTNTFIAVVNALVRRIMNDNQGCAVIGFRYIDTLKPVWGYDWTMSLLDILPGKNSYFDMETRIFAIIYGGANGTAPPCIWGSAYYNWSYFGVTLFPLLLGYIYEGVYIRFLRKEKTQIMIAMNAGIFVLLGYWTASTPMYLINDGLVTIIILNILLSRISLERSTLIIRRDTFYRKY